MTDQNDARPVRVRARVRLLTAADGGRTSPLVGGTSYRPNHNFFGPDNREMAVGIIDLPPDVSLAPGETKELEIAFLFWPEVRTLLVPGKEWRIQEGPQVVGIGTVLDVFK